VTIYSRSQPHPAGHFSAKSVFQSRLCLGALTLLAAQTAWATPTGLNNIPTADVVPHRTVAVQAFSSFGAGANQFSANGPDEHSFWLGFKAGWSFQPVNLEVGLDSPIAPGDAGPLYGRPRWGSSFGKVARPRSAWPASP
jgi:hypothetical protein